jgi:hypothetical protein
MPELTEADVNNALASLRSLANIGDEAVRDQATRTFDETYRLYGIRAFAAADAWARHVGPRLVAEVKRLSGWA